MVSSNTFAPTANRSICWRERLESHIEVVRGAVDKDSNQKGGLGNRSLAIPEHHPSEIKELVASSNSLALASNRSMLN